MTTLSQREPLSLKCICPDHHEVPFYCPKHGRVENLELTTSSRLINTA